MQILNENTLNDSNKYYWYLVAYKVLKSGVEEIKTVFVPYTTQTILFTSGKLNSLAEEIKSKIYLDVESLEIIAVSFLTAANKEEFNS